MTTFNPKPEPASVAPEALLRPDLAGLLMRIQQLSDRILETSTSGDVQILGALIEQRGDAVEKLTALLATNLLEHLSEAQQLEFNRQIAICQAMDRQIEQNFQTVLKALDQRIQKTYRNKTALNQYQILRPERDSTHSNQA